MQEKPECTAELEHIEAGLQALFSLLYIYKNAHQSQPGQRSQVVGSSQAITTGEVLPRAAVLPHHTAQKQGARANTYLVTFLYNLQLNCVTPAATDPELPPGLQWCLQAVWTGKSSREKKELVS